ncbi:MAG: 16S rRNA (uracil(1498)-N(3))-methyltransferase [Alistipes sp.]|nr:16S rRNA (uracil(1498)-N(3))-methyltransferase [Candidatus Alistipes equi]
MQLFFSPNCTDEEFILSPEEARHALLVLRMRVGDFLYLTDGVGHLCEAVIMDASPKKCLLKKKCVTFYKPLDYELTMCIAPTKNIDRFEWFLEKATEIGISRIIPILCEHSERRTINLERERKVILSAVKQSLKMYVPTLEDMTPFRTIVENASSKDCFIAHCENSDNQKEYFASIVKAATKTIVMIGPEGDFSHDEILFATKRGFKEISLGEQRFRTETAAIVATDIVSIVNTLKR